MFVVRHVAYVDQPVVRRRAMIRARLFFFLGKLRYILK